MPRSQKNEFVNASIQHGDGQDAGSTGGGKTDRTLGSNQDSQTDPTTKEGRGAGSR